MNTIINALQSRTVWSVVALFIVSGTNGIMGLIPVDSLIYVQGFLSILVMYFKLNPSKTY
jgi:hypothetical protein